MRDAPPAPPGAYVSDAPRPLRDPRILRLGVASGLLVCAQAAMLGFIVLFLHDEEGLSAAFAAVLLAGLQLAGAVGRIVAGRRSDREERRIMPMRRHALAATGLIVASAVLTPAPNWVVVPLVMVAGVATMCWNGLAFTVAAEISGREQAGTAMSVQNTDRGRDRHRAGGVRRFVEFTSWPPAFVALAACPLAAWWVLAPLVDEEERRADAREARLALAATRNAETGVASATGS